MAVSISTVEMSSLKAIENDEKIWYADIKGKRIKLKV